MVFATIWTRRQNWNKYDSPKSGSGVLSEKANNNYAFNPRPAIQTTKISTLHFGDADRAGESEFESSEGKQMAPNSSESKEKSGWSDGMPSTTTTV